MSVAANSAASGGRHCTTLCSRARRYGLRAGDALSRRSPARGGRARTFRRAARTAHPASRSSGEGRPPSAAPASALRRAAQRRGPSAAAAGGCTAAAARRAAAAAAARTEQLRHVEAERAGHHQRGAVRRRHENAQVGRGRRRHGAAAGRSCRAARARRAAETRAGAGTGGRARHWAQGHHVWRPAAGARCDMLRELACGHRRRWRWPNDGSAVIRVQW